MARNKKDIAPDPNQIKKLYLVFELPQGEIEPIIQKIKQHKRFKYYWESNVNEK